MKNIIFLLIPFLFVSCARTIITDKDGIEQEDGMEFSYAEPYLLVTTDKEGVKNMSIISLPGKKMKIRNKSGWGSSVLNVKLSNGMLTGLDNTVDSQVDETIAAVASGVVGGLGVVPPWITAYKIDSAAGGGGGGPFVESLRDTRDFLLRELDASQMSDLQKVRRSIENTIDLMITNYNILSGAMSQDVADESARKFYSGEKTLIGYLDILIVKGSTDAYLKEKVMILTTVKNNASKWHESVVKPVDTSPRLYKLNYIGNQLKFELQEDFKI